MAADPGQIGDPALDTAAWPGSPQGNLRVSYVLPSSGWGVVSSRVNWPTDGTLGPDGQAAGPHRLVWVDISSAAKRP